MECCQGGLTHNVALVLAVVELRAADLHLHKGADDAATVLREVPSAQDLEEENPKTHQLKGIGVAIFRRISYGSVILSIASLPAELII